jgi:CheY-like chemotaxis protein
MTPEILLVDDDPSICEVITEVLDILGVHVTVTPSGKEGIAALNAGLRPAVILLDMMMPETDGIWFCREMAKNPKIRDIPVIILSACDKLESVASGLPISGILRKPIGIDDLLSTVQPYLKAAS